MKNLDLHYKAAALDWPCVDLGTFAIAGEEAWRKELARDLSAEQRRCVERALDAVRIAYKVTEERLRRRIYKLERELETLRADHGQAERSLREWNRS